MTRHGQYPSAALADVGSERLRQIEKEGWTSIHDDQHDAGEMASAAACYALHPFNWHLVVTARSKSRLLSLEDFWPWEWRWFKPTDRRRNLVKAAALIVAEIERMDRSPHSRPQHREVGK